jgi:hypothetical protein
MAHPVCSIAAVDAGAWAACEDCLRPPLNDPSATSSGLACACPNEAETRSWTRHPRPLTFLPQSCRLKWFSSEDARALLANRKIVFVGDSVSQELASDLIALLENTVNWPIKDHQHDWVRQESCGRTWPDGYEYRQFSTAANPSPQLRAHNITVTHIWNGSPGVSLSKVLLMCSEQLCLPFMRRCAIVAALLPRFLIRNC